MCVLCVSRSMWRALAGQKSKTMDGQTTGVRCDASLAYPPLPPWDDSIHSFILALGIFLLFAMQPVKLKTTNTRVLKNTIISNNDIRDKVS